MFGSVAPILVTPDDKDSGSFEKVSSVALFELLQALEKDVPDDLDILELVTGDKPLQALVQQSDDRTSFETNYTQSSPISHQNDRP